MPNDLPLFKQTKPETCALACLRMVLGACGIHVSEETLERQVHMEEGGSALRNWGAARAYGLAAEIQEATMDDLRQILAEGKLPIAYVNRSVFALRALRHVRQA